MLLVFHAKKAKNTGWVEILNSGLDSRPGRFITRKYLPVFTEKDAG
jgi:hypothetical protein